jgi:hypothetical protein
MTTCGDHRIIIQNRTGVEIKVTKFEYMDGNRSKTENMFFGGSDTIDDGDQEDYTRNFEGIGNQDTTFTLTYQHRTGNNWTGNRVHRTDAHCDDDETTVITVTDRP